MEKKLLIFARSHNMLEKGDGIVVGVSGGADSMSLLLFLMSQREAYELKLLVLHVNHGIRGESADRDEHFVEDFCRRNALDFECVHADIPTLARESGCTEEEAGRNLRYKEFERACSEHGYNKIAVAHNRDDNSETVLFNLFRGSGISGIRGIAPVRKLGRFTVIRPLLAVSRSEIEEYLAQKGVSYCTDETNLETDYSRNRIRHRVLPYVKEQINEGASRHIAELASQAAEFEEFLEDMTTERMKELEDREELRYKTIEGAVNEISIDREKLLSMNRLLRRNIIRRLLGTVSGSLKDIESKHIDAVDRLLAMKTGKRADLPYRITARRDYDRLVLGRKKTEEQAPLGIECSVPGSYPLPDGRGRLDLCLKEAGGEGSIPKNNYTKWFDYDKISSNIVIRNRQPGDYLLIGGEDGKLCRKSLKSYLIDSKTDREKRDVLPLLAEGSHVLWIIGERRDDSCKVGPETARILTAELTDLNCEAVSVSEKDESQTEEKQ